MIDILPHVIIKAISMSAADLFKLLDEDGLALIDIAVHGEGFIYCNCKQKKFPHKREYVAVDSEKHVVIAPRDMI